MELPNVDNEFISLFISDSSSFQSEEILEEFKIYIFKIMNLPIDLIFQEQINNEYEKNVLTTNLKGYLFDNFDSAIEINALFNQSCKKIKNIKNSLENNKLIVEKNLDKSEVDAIFIELNKIYTDIVTNKAFATKNQIIIDLINIPCILINLLKLNNIELFIEYVRYVENLPEDVFKKYKVMEIVRNTVAFIKSVAQKFFLNNLRLKKFSYDYVLINEILDIPFYDCILPIVNEHNKQKLIELNILIHSFELSINTNKSSESTCDLKEIVNNFYKNIQSNFLEIIKKITEIDDLTAENKEVLVIKIIDNHFLINSILSFMFNSVTDYHFNRELIMNLLDFLREKIEFYLKTNFLPHSNQILKLEEICRTSFEKFIENLSDQNKFFVQKFLSEKDMNGILKISEDKENENKYEFLVILSHNLRCLINAILAYGIYYSIPQKSEFLSKIDKVILEIISIIKHHFESKFLVSKDSIILVNFSSFLDKLIELFGRNLSFLYNSFKLQKFWEKSEKELKVK